KREWHRRDEPEIADDPGSHFGERSKRRTPNAERRMLNSEPRLNSTFDVGHWTFGIGFILAFQPIELIDVARSVVAINRDHERETHPSFRGGDRDRKDRDHYAGRCLRLRTEAPERY